MLVSSRVGHLLSSIVLMFVSEFLWGLAQSGFSDSRFFVRAAEVAIDKANEMDSTDLLTTLWAFARANRPVAGFVDQAFCRFPAEIQKYDARQLTSLCWAVARVCGIEAA